MKTVMYEFPKTIDAAEIEDGINNEVHWPLCIEIAKRYNCHNELIETLSNVLEELNNVQLKYGNTCRSQLEITASQLIININTHR